jgi:hypothetical protein
MKTLKFVSVLCFACIWTALTSAASFAKSQEPEVKDFVTRWVNAQNTGNFSTYGEFYASPFSGIRRSGSRIRIMDRTGWLKDRKAMFKHPMTVTISSMNVTTIGDRISVSFIQDWKSATYHDVGKKALLLSKTVPLKIVREEMLDSQLLHENLQNVQEIEAERPLYLYPHGIVLAEAPDMNWGDGPISVKQDDSIASQNVKLDALPSELRIWNGADVVLVGDNGPVCTATIEQINLIARIDGFSQLTNNSDDPAALQNAKQQRAEGIWETARNTGQAVKLIGRIGSNRRDCEKARWASLKSIKLPSIIMPTSADSVLRKRALKEFAKLPDFIDLQRSFEQKADKPQPGRWDEEGVTTTRQVETIHSANGITVLVVTAKGGEFGACDSQEFYGELTAIWKLDGDQWTLVGSRTQYLPIESAADLNGDGLPELFFGPTNNAGSDRIERGYLQSDKGHYERSTTVSFPYYGCEC